MVDQECWLQLVSSCAQRRNKKKEIRFTHTHPSRDIVLPPVLATDIHAESVPPVHKERKESVSTLNGVVSILDPVPQLV